MQGGEAGLEFIDGEALRDMLRAIPVERFDLDDHRPFGPRTVGLIMQRGDEIRVFSGINKPHAAPDLQASLVRVIHQDQRNPVIGRQIADAQILPVSTKISVGNCLGVDNLQEAGWTAAKLNVGPTGF